MKHQASTICTALVVVVLLGLATSAFAGGALTPKKTVSVTIANDSNSELDVFDGYATWSCDGDGHRKELVTSSIYIAPGSSRTFKYEMSKHCAVSRGDFRITAKGTSHSKYVNRMFNEAGATLHITNQDVSKAKLGHLLWGD